MGVLKFLMLLIMKLSAQPNPDFRRHEGISTGFQRQVLADAAVSRRDFLRTGVSSTGNSAVVTTDPVQPGTIRAFRSDAVTCCLEHAAINRTSTAPVLVQLQSYQSNSIKLTPQGTGTGSFHDTVIGAVSVNQGHTYQPTPWSSGAQITLSNILGNPINIAITDLQGNLVTDLLGFYVSLCFFERLPPTSVAV